jgi:hypothetical protein
MRSITREAGTLLVDTEADENAWLQHNPMGVQTEREAAVLDKGFDIFRCVFTKQQ